MADTAVVTVVPPLFDEAKLVVAGLLARYSGPTGVSDSCDLRQWFSWCHHHDDAEIELVGQWVCLPPRPLGPRAACAGRVCLGYRLAVLPCR